MTTTCNTVEDQTVYVAAYKGDDVAVDVTLFDIAGGLLDVTGWEWAAQLRTAADVLEASWTVDDTAAADGLVTLALPSATTDSLTAADYMWDLEATDPDDSVRTLVRGQLRIREDVTS